MINYNRQIYIFEYFVFNLNKTLKILILMLNTIKTNFVFCILGRNGNLSRDLNLPYIRACILEVMRLRTTVPLSIPRSATCDAVVNGYHIPKGTEVCK